MVVEMLLQTWAVSEQRELQLIFKHQKQFRCDYHNLWQVQGGARTGLTCRELWNGNDQEQIWLLLHSEGREE